MKGERRGKSDEKYGDDDGNLTIKTMVRKKIDKAKRMMKMESTIAREI
jgi:hypothetical protein